MRGMPAAGLTKRRVNHVRIPAAMARVLSVLGKDPPHKECDEAAGIPLRGCSQSANECELYPTALIHTLFFHPLQFLSSVPP